MKILHCFGKMDIGGAETMMMNVFRNINKEKYSFDFLVFNKESGKYDDEIYKLGGKIYYLPSLGEVGPISYINNIRNFLLKHHYDVIHSHMDWQGGYIVYAAYLAKVSKRIVHSHAIQKNFKIDIFHSVAIYVAKMMIQLFATKKCACSIEAYKSLFISQRYPIIIKNGIELNKYLDIDFVQLNNLKRRLRLGKNDIVLGHIGSFSENKNQRFLIQLLENLLKKDSNYKLMLIGTGKTLESIKKKVKDKGLEKKVIFTGVIKDIPLYASMFDCFLFPSIYEGLGIVAIEAQALGIPCFISNSVPNEVDLGLGLVDFISLNNMNEWEWKILNKPDKCKDKKLIRDKFKEKGYNINESIKAIEQLYNM